jgi:hypothetical protein
VGGCFSDQICRINESVETTVCQRFQQNGISLFPRSRVLI